MSSKNVAFLMVDVPDLSGGGGAERFFYDFYLRNNASENHKYNIHFYTNETTNLERVSYLDTGNNYLRVFKTFSNKFFRRFTDKSLLLKETTQFCREFLTFVPLYFSFLKNKIEVLHVPLYEAKDYYLLWFFDKLAIYKRPKISISIVDCRIPYRYFSKDSLHYYSSEINYGRLFRNIRIDGFLSWYKLFKEFVEQEKIVKRNNFIYCIRSRYSIIDVVDCWEQKKNWIVFAGRLDDQKDPEFFLQAVNEVIKAGRAKDFVFKIFGKGPLKEKLETYIIENNLQVFVKVDFHSKMREIFIQSKCFVSTQLFENFPSMSMAEAMACQNAVIAKNVGQSELFVKEGVNGFLINEKNTADLAAKLMEYIDLPETEKKKLGLGSSTLLSEVHTFENFRDQFNEYVDNLLLQRK